MRKEVPTWYTKEGRELCRIYRDNELMIIVSTVTYDELVILSQAIKEALGIIHAKLNKPQT